MRGGSVVYTNYLAMKSTGNGDNHHDEKQRPKDKFIKLSKAQRLAEKEYEEYYHRIKMISKGY